MRPLRLFLSLTIALAACSAEDESLGRKEGTVSNDGGVLACTTPNPQGCTTVGCPRGQYCYPTAGSREAGAPACVPSSCSCNTLDGTWDCTFDCGGGTCRYPDDAPIPRGEAGPG